MRGYRMSKKYVFRYEGTKKMFLEQINWSNGYFDDKARYKYINDYILKLINDEIHFGVCSFFIHTNFLSETEKGGGETGFPAPEN